MSIVKMEGWIISVVFFVFVGVQASPLGNVKPSDLIIGQLNDGDKKLTSFWIEDYPHPDINLTSATVGLGSESIKISYVTVIEYGNCPDARVKLLEGGPGFNIVRVELIPGPSSGFNYTTTIYGTELKKFESSNEFSKSIKKYYSKFI